MNFFKLTLCTFFLYLFLIKHAISEIKHFKRLHECIMTQYHVIHKTTKNKELRNNEGFTILEKDGVLKFSKTNALFGGVTYFSSDKTSINSGSYSAGTAGFAFSTGTMIIENFDGKFIFFQIGGNALKQRFKDMELIFANCNTAVLK